MKILGIIPSRYGSSRFPAKALADIMGKSMIQRVYEQAIKCKDLQKVLVATDHDLIYRHVTEFGGTAIMTSEHHQSGTDRCMEAYIKNNMSYDFIINIQGDEPFIHPEQISLLCKSLSRHTELATLIKKIEDQETLFNNNTPKVIFNHKNESIYFSRHPIPFVRGIESGDWLFQQNYYKHIGIYAYRTDILEKITKLPVSSLEKAEALEQLRWLENGYKINVTQTHYDCHGIDTPEDLQKIVAKFPAGTL